MQQYLSLWDLISLHKSYNKTLLFFLPALSFVQSHILAKLIQFIPAGNLEFDSRSFVGG